MQFFCLIFVTGIGILISFAGWGSLVVRLLRVPYPRSFGLNAAVGLALSTNVGGVLDYLHAISATTVRVYLGLGLLLFCALSLPGIRAGFGQLAESIRTLKHKQLVLAIGIIVVCVTLFKYASALSPGVFHLQDDYHAYFVFPVKMLETGSLGQDPFSERRLISSLGGNAFLDTFPLSVTGDVRTLSLVDQGTAYLILLLLVAGIMARKGIAAHWIALVLLVVAAIPAPISNITAMYSGIAMLLLAMDLLDRGVDEAMSGQVILLSIVLASLASLKSTFAPVAAFLFITFFVLQFMRLPDKRRSLLWAGGCTALIVLLLSPWMIDSYHSSGTYFYPVFGRGVHGSRYGTYLLPTASMGFHNILAFLNGIINAVGAALACLAYLVFATPNQTRHDKLVQAAIVINVIVDEIVIGIGTGGVQMYRYSFAVLFPFVLFLLIEQLVAFKSFSPLALSTPANIGVVISYGLLLGAGLNGFAEEQKGRFAELTFALKGEQIVSPSEAASYREMQSSIPPGQKVMVRLDKNFLLDFRRNPVYINDLPGGASLPPGIPIFQGPDALSNYLLAHGIRYLAYSYGDEATFSRTEFKDRLQPDVNVWLRRGAEIAFDFQDNALALGHTRKKLFDDGRMFVLDLASATSSTGQEISQPSDPGHSIASISGASHR
jgi:hypothetical protein